MKDRIPPLEITHEELRSLVLEALERIVGSGNSIQLRAVLLQTASVAVDRGAVPNPHGAADTRGNRFVLQMRDDARVQDVIWDLIVEGVLRHGDETGKNPDWPWLHLTELGRSIVEGEASSPYDPSGYLGRLQREVEGIDEVILLYLDEALRAFRINCRLSASVCLGAAAEKVMHVVLECLIDSLPENRSKKLRDKTVERGAKRQFEELLKRIDDLKPKLSREILDHLDVRLSGLFSIIRELRNDAGHPTGRVPEREVVQSNLIAFPAFAKAAYSVVDWLRSNRID